MSQLAKTTNFIFSQLKRSLFRRSLWIGILLSSLVAAQASWLNSFSVAEAAIPKLINFQGKLTKNSDGTNVANGSYAFQFKLYDALTSGNLLWTETYDQASGACAKLVVTNGVFNAKLGSCNSLSGIDFTTGSLYLSVNFAPTGTSYDSEMSPRKQLASAAFAFNANSVVGDGKIDIQNTAPNQATIGYDSSNKLQVSVGSSGFTTLTANGSGAGFNLAGGNVGINTASPSYKLHVSDNSGTYAVGVDYSGGQYAYLANITTSNPNGAYRAIFNSGNNGMRGYLATIPDGAASITAFQADITSNTSNDYNQALVLSGSPTSAITRNAALAQLGYNSNVTGTLMSLDAGKTTNTALAVTQGNVGIGTSSPSGKLTLAGNSSISAWGLNGVALQGAAATYTDSSTAVSGTATNAVFNSFAVPTLAATNSSVTTTNAATLYVAGAPTAGTNQTITNPYALWVGAGTTRLDGNLTVSGTTTFSGGLNPGFTQGSVIFQGASGLAQNNSQFYWDNTNNRLGIGTTSPGTKLDVVASTYNNALKIGDGNNYFTLGRNVSDGSITIDGGANSSLFKVSNAGTQYLQADSTGLISGGTGTPFAGLSTKSAVSYLGLNATFASNVANTSYLVMRNVNNGYKVALGNDGNGNLQFYTRGDNSDFTSGNERMRIDSSGNVGIGTTSPGYKLDVAGSAQFIPSGTAGLLIDASSTSPRIFSNAKIVYQSNATSTIQHYFGNAIGSALTGTLMQIDTASGDIGSSQALLKITGNSSTPVATFTAGGNLGVGTTSPQAKLEVTSSSSLDNTLAVSGVATGNSNQQNFGNIGGTLSGTNTYDSIGRGVQGLYLSPTVASGATVTNFNGIYVLPQILNPSANTVTNITGIQTYTGYGYASNNTTVTNAKGVWIKNYGGVQPNTAFTNQYGLYVDSITGATNNYSIYSAGGTSYFAGNVGIANTAPAQKLDVTGTIRQSNATNCTLTANASGDLQCLSDERTKDIAGSYVGGWEQLSLITPIKFNYKNENYTHVGFSAQNVGSVLPEATPLQKSGYFGLDTTAVLALNVNATKDLGLKINNWSKADSVSENYVVAESGIQTGDVVKISTAGIKKAHGPYTAAIGVVSTDPGLVLSGSTQNSVPVALAGRVPVKVTTENGTIEPGDFLTTSSTVPGAAMKATKAGPVIGQALSSYSDSGIGQVVLFVKPASYNGLAIDRQLSGISFDYTQSQSGIAANSIAILNSLKDNLGNSVNQTNSQVVTDVVVAGKELISPYITVDSLRVNTISAAASQGGLVIEQSTAIKGGLKIDRLSSLADALAIDSDVEFFGRPYFTSDTVGFAKILPGQRFVDVVFDKQYLNQPTVSAMLTLEDDPQLQNETDPAVIAQIRTAQDAQTDLLFNEGYQFIVSRKSEKGFRIILNKPASQNLYFSWIALATKQPKIFISQATEQPPVQSGSTAGSSDGSTGSLPPLDLGSPDGSDNNSDSSAPDTTTDSSGTTGDSSITGS